MNNIILFSSYITKKEFLIRIYEGSDYIIEVPDLALGVVAGFLLLGIYSVINKNK
tara:strand:- start:2468 stop:2632 length:165 start_codon:yes stop_codon:yes gene_type:complete